MLDATTLAPIRTWNANDLGAPVGASIAFASDDVLLVPTFGSMDAGTVDHLVSVDVATGGCHDACNDKAAFDFGEVRCASGCGACFLTDADTSKPRLRRFSIDASGAITGETDVAFGDANLPPRYLGAY